MIHVTQGHERGIGLEVFFKALQLAPRSWSTEFRLYATERAVRATMGFLGFPFELTPSGIHFSGFSLSTTWVSPSAKLPESTVCFVEGLAHAVADARGVLFTLPTTKEDLRDPATPKKLFLGHTELLRHLFDAPDLGMFFVSPQLRALLLTDHVPLSLVPTVLTARALKSKMSLSLKTLRRLEPQLTRAYVAGVNPHAGEGGLLGRDELKLKSTLAGIRSPGLMIEGFLSGDSLLSRAQSPADLLVYSFHDQGLAAFKALCGTVGANVTLGLPRLRLSVDHGTAFDLYGKNKADPLGALYCLRQSLVYQEKLYGKNSNFQGPRS